MKIIHQAGHNSNWNRDSFEQGLEPYRHDSYKNSKKKYINIEQDLA